MSCGTMKRVRSTREGFGPWDQYVCHLPFHFRREQAPAALIAAFNDSEKLSPALKGERNPSRGSHTRVCVIYEYLVSGLVDTFVSALERAMVRKKIYSSEEIADMKARAPEVMRGVVGGLLQLRLYNIAIAHRLDPQEVGPRPTIDPNIQLPRPLARAISSIGVFRPAGVVPETTFLPKYSREPGLAARSGNLYQSEAYAEIFPVFAKCGIATSKVEIRNCDSTSWYLLEVERNAEKQDLFEVVATFPPQSGNISVTDAITRTYCLHQDLPRFEADKGLHTVRKHLYAHVDHVGSNCGVVLADVKHLSEPIDFMEVDMATRPERVRSARDRERLERARNSIRIPVAQINRGAVPQVSG